MQELIHEPIQPIHAWTESAAPAVEDARRRFILALRAMILTKQREEKDRAAVETWKATLQREIRGYRLWRAKRRLRWAIIIGVCLFFQLIVHWNLREWWWLWFVFGGGGAAAD